MKASLARAVLAGALIAGVAPLAAPAQAMTCGELSDVCSFACNTTSVTRKICSGLG